VKLAEAFGGVGLRATKPDEVDDLIKEMIAVDRTVIADISVDPAENCFPMIPSGKAHNEMILGSSGVVTGEQTVSEDGMVLV
jgi:acetolactate synthase-1/2/3 large subunit